MNKNNDRLFGRGQVGQYFRLYMFTCINSRTEEANHENDHE